MRNQKKKIKPERKWTQLLTVFIIFNITLASAMFYLAKRASEYKEEKQTQIAQKCEGLDINGQCFNLERAETNQARIKGLSERDDLPQNTGLLFLFDRPANQCIWMKDMRFNLDIIWLDRNKKIIKIEKNISPATYPNAYCSEETRYVLEFNAGFSDRHGLNVGTELKF